MKHRDLIFRKTWNPAEKQVADLQTVSYVSQHLQQQSRRIHINLKAI